MTNTPAEQTKAKKVTTPRKPMGRGTRRFIAVLASILWGMLVTMLSIDWLSGLYTAANMTTVLPAVVFLLSAVPLAIAAITTKQLKLLAHLYQPLVVAGLPLIVFPLYVPSIILIGTIWIALVWVSRTPKFWGQLPGPEGPGLDFQA